jgi:hypothetical protein
MKMEKNPFFESSEGQLILKNLKKELDFLHQIKMKTFSKDPIEAEKARKEFKSYFEKTNTYLEKMNDQTFELFMRMKKYFNDHSNFSGEQLAVKDELIDSFNNLLVPTIPKVQKEKKSSFSSKLKGPKKWKRS